ncbi:branched-chain amino acid ABC transporter substrate-binding protein [Ottowia sp.]|uniref:branched-chain amino acid ABC transporter substrate-binding protein n=1 Tax=Ottowia sp. TaxID=1898956 RepID=UPI003A881F8D
MKFKAKLLVSGVLAAMASGAWAQQGQTVKIAWIDPLSGLMAPVGANGLKAFQFFAEKVSQNNPAGVKFEIVPMDNKLSPAESATALKTAINQDIHYIAQGNGSSVAAALIDGVSKHNQRNPGKEVLYINYAAVDPDFTNSKCNYWHFRYDADTSMKMEAIANFIKEMPEVKKVYLLNQDYSHGHQVAKYAKESLKRLRPDIQIAGEDLHPLAKVRDFAPYIAKIKASGADSVITGNWGSDLALMIKAAREAGYEGKFFTYYVITTGTPTALGESGAGKVYQVAYAHYNMAGDMGKWTAEFKKRYNDDLYATTAYTALESLAQAMATAKSTDPVKVAAALEGMKFKSYNGEVEMRKADHQLQQPLFMTVWEKASAKYPYSPEGTGMTLAPVKEYPAYVASTPTTCQMKRP